MDWICFGDSAKGMLELFGIREVCPESHIIDLRDDLSIGDLSNLQDRKARGFGICPWKNDPEFSDVAKECMERYFEEALSAFEAVSEAVIWYGDNPYEQCGMLRAAHDLYARGIPFSLVHVDRLSGEELLPPRPSVKRDGAFAVCIITDHKLLNGIFRNLPQWLLKCMHYHTRLRRYRKQRRDWVTVYSGVGEIEPEVAAVFYRKKRMIPRCEAKLLYTRWEQLMSENAPLRVLKGGKVVSAPLEYYDEAILRHAPEKETAAAMVVGRTLAEYHINDSFIFERIRALAASGKLELVKNGENYRETTIRKRSGVDG